MSPQYPIPLTKDNVEEMISLARGFELAAKAFLSAGRKGTLDEEDAKALRQAFELLDGIEGSNFPPI